MRFSSSRHSSSSSPGSLLALPPCAEPVTMSGGGRAREAPGVASASDAGAPQGFCSTALSCLCTHRLSLRLTSVLMKQIPADKRRIHGLQSSPTSVSRDGLLLSAAACSENRSVRSRRPGGSSSRTRPGRVYAVCAALCARACSPAKPTGACSHLEATSHLGQSCSKNQFRQDSCVQFFILASFTTTKCKAFN